jgi:hypothetical protein
LYAHMNNKKKKKKEFLNLMKIITPLIRTERF